MKSNESEEEASKFRPQKSAKNWKLLLDPQPDEQLRFIIGGMWDLYNIMTSIEYFEVGTVFQNVVTTTIKIVIMDRENEGKKKLLSLTERQWKCTTNDNEMETTE